LSEEGYPAIVTFLDHAASDAPNRARPARVSVIGWVVEEDDERLLLQMYKSDEEGFETAAIPKYFGVVRASVVKIEKLRLERAVEVR